MNATVMPVLLNSSSLDARGYRQHVQVTLSPSSLLGNSPMNRSRAFSVAKYRSGEREAVQINAKLCKIMVRE